MTIPSTLWLSLLCEERRYQSYSSAAVKIFLTPVPFSSMYFIQSGSNSYVCTQIKHTFACLPLMPALGACCHLDLTLSSLDWIERTYYYFFLEALTSFFHQYFQSIRPFTGQSYTAEHFSGLGPVSCSFIFPPLNRI